MGLEKRRRQVLIVTGTEKSYEFFTELLPPAEFYPITMAKTAGEARRGAIDNPADIVIINTPLSDDFGLQLALDLAESSAGILLLVKADLYEQVAYQAEEAGVLTLSKPNSRQALYTAVRLLSAVNARLWAAEQKNRSFQEKMADIRAVNRDKWLLIEKHNMTEKEAHYYIEKQAMDARVPRRKIAENIIRSYDS